MRTTRLAVVAVLLALVGPAIGLAAPAVALAAPADAPPAYLRLAHLSPDTPTVDVYVDSAADPSRSFVVPGVGYGAVSQYQPLPPDSYVISMRPAGARRGVPAGHLRQRGRQPGRGVHGRGHREVGEPGAVGAERQAGHPAGGQGQRAGDQRGAERAVGRRRPGERAGVGDRAWSSAPRPTTSTARSGNWDLEVTAVRDVDDGAADAGGELDLHRAADRQGRRAGAAGHPRQHRRRHGAVRRRSRPGWAARPARTRCSAAVAGGGGAARRRAGASVAARRARRTRPVRADGRAPAVTSPAPGGAGASGRAADRRPSATRCGGRRRRVAAGRRGRARPARVAARGGRPPRVLAALVSTPIAAVAGDAAPRCTRAARDGGAPAHARTSQRPRRPRRRARRRAPAPGRPGRRRLVPCAGRRPASRGPR